LWGGEYFSVIEHKRLIVLTIFYCTNEISVE